MRADARVVANGPWNFTNVGAGSFANRRDSVDTADALSQERICCQFRELGGPDWCDENSVLWNPVFVHWGEHFKTTATSRSFLVTADQDSVWEEEVFHCSSFGKELGVRQDCMFNLKSNRVWLKVAFVVEGRLFTAEDLHIRRHGLARGGLTTRLHERQHVLERYSFQQQPLIQWSRQLAFLQRPPAWLDQLPGPVITERAEQLGRAR